MSMNTSIVYGYGFELDLTDDKKFFEFLNNHKDTIKKFNDGEDILNFIKDPESNDIGEFREKFDSRESFSGEGEHDALNVISDIIREETGIRFTYEYYDGEEYILFAECLPWLLNEKEKVITKEEMKKICIKYMEELGLPTEEKYEGQLIGAQEIRYFG